MITEILKETNKSEGDLMENNWMEQSVGDIVAKLPIAAGLFKNEGIDFCCGGHRLLSNVIRDQRVDEHEIVLSLEKEWEKAQQNAESRNFAHMEPTKLASYIETRHHAYLKEALPDIGEILTAVLRAHGRNHPELYEVHAAFGKLRTELEEHLIKEETLLFPQIAKRERADAQAMDILTQKLRLEHEEAGELVKEIHQLTKGYETPQDGCATYRMLMEKLVVFEDDLFQHIHLENNILFKSLGH